MNHLPKNNVLLDVVSISLQISRKFFEPYSCAKSPHKFTQSQLLSCLILKAYLKTTYRGVIEALEVSPTLCERLGLSRLPHFSTLKKFADRSSVLEIVDRMLAEIVQQYGAVDDEAAMDSTGLEMTSASSHFQTRTGRQRRKYVKLSVCVMVGSLLPAILVVSWGPYNDKREARPLLEKIKTVIQPKQLFADKGYDAEWVHEFCRDDWKVTSWIPPAVHRKDGQVNGRHRSLMTTETLNENGYGRRWTVESFMSGLKRTMGDRLSVRTERPLFIKAGLKVLAYALRR